MGCLSSVELDRISIFVIQKVRAMCVLSITFSTHLRKEPVSSKTLNVMAGSFKILRHGRFTSDMLLFPFLKRTIELLHTQKRPHSQRRQPPPLIFNRDNELFRAPAPHPMMHWPEGSDSTIKRDLSMRAALAAKRN